MFWLSLNEYGSLLSKFSNRSELVVMETRRSFRSTESGTGSDDTALGSMVVVICLGGSIAVALNVDSG